MKYIRSSLTETIIPVSYTHLDVYKRQALNSIEGENTGYCFVSVQDLEDAADFVDVYKRQVMKYTN